MSLRYVFGRVLFFFVVVWAGTTLIFFLPRLAQGRDPIRERLGMMSAMGGMHQDNIELMAKSYEAKFGLDQPLWKQYLRYLGDMARFNLGYSLAKFPTRVSDVIAIAIPWTIALLGVSTLIAFTMEACWVVYWRGQVRRAHYAICYPRFLPFRPFPFTCSA